LAAGLWSTQAFADSAKLTETKVDKVKCRTYRADGQRITEWGQETTGRFNISTFISPDTFESWGGYLDDVDEDTPLLIRIGNFEFSDTLGNAYRKTKTSRNLSGTWLATHEECSYNKKLGQDICKNVTDTTVNIAASFKGARINVKGKWSEQQLFGQQVFVEFLG
jgi:hypothetical protein